ncbi:MFS transporter [Sphingomonas sp. ID0503]|uniref:MFS transporter n=1 Tax=Sphingomonas sp. ID0503 TaxID=3399691 RepID=UPI003AFB80AA
MPPAEPRSALHIPIFRAIWLASLLSNFGGLIQSVGASWLMTSLTSSPQLVALVQASTTLPIMLLSLLSGAIADNLDRRKVMLAAQGAMLTAAIGLSLFAWAGWLTPWTLLTFTFLVGCGSALNLSSWQASVGDMVPRAMLPNAVALNSMGFNLARSVGPAIGGAIVAAAGAAAAFLVNAFSYLGMIGVLLRWTPPAKPSDLPRERLGMAMAAGVRYAAMSPNIRAILLRAAMFGVSASAVNALMPLVARHMTGGGALGYGVLLGGFGVGAVGGALLSTRLRRRLSAERIVVGASLGMGAGAAITALSTVMVVTVAALGLCGACWVLALSTFNVTVQMSAPRWVVARCLSLYQMMAFGGMTLGAWGFGVLAEERSVEAALLVAAVLQLVPALAGRWIPLPEADNLNLDPLARFTEPHTTVPVTPQSGPITVSIDYRIPADRILEFLNVMDERRRIRRRDGARHWTLLRDLADERSWTERYSVPTWVDYVRHNTRRTQADAENSERILALHEGPESPRVTRMIERQTVALPPMRTIVAETAADPVTDATRSS